MYYHNREMSIDDLDKLSKIDKKFNYALEEIGYFHFWTR